MEYLPPKALAEKFWKSLKTIYNRLQKHGDKIRTKSELWKTIVNCNDFEKVFQNYNPNYKIVTKKIEKSKAESDFEDWNKDFVNLQNDYKIAVSKIDDLQSYNSNLNTQIKEYALLYTEEKGEKKELQNKLDDLHDKFTQKIETFSLERTSLVKKRYLTLGITFVFGAIVLWFIFPTILEQANSLYQQFFSAQ